MEIDFEKLQKELLAIKEMNALWEKRRNALESLRSKKLGNNNNKFPDVDKNKSSSGNG